MPYILPINRETKRNESDDDKDDDDNDGDCNRSSYLLSLALDSKALH